MGSTLSSKTYVKGGGSHHSVPVALNSKIDLYKSNKKVPSKTSFNKY